MTEADAVLNAETRRALRNWGRRLFAIGAGVLTALVLLISIAVTAVRPAGVLFHLAVTLAFSLVLPIIAAYVAVRAYGLTHDEVIYVGKRVIGTAVEDISTLSDHQDVRRSHTDEQRDDTNDPTTLITDTDDEDPR
jgi:hypothetical protein